MALPTPRTWVDDEDVTFARLNTIRDGLSALNSFAALIAVNPDSQGTATYLRITRPSASAILEGWISGESFPRIRVRPGSIGFGDGSSDPTAVLQHAGPATLSMAGSLSVNDLDVRQGPLLLSADPEAHGDAYVEFPNVSAAPAAPNNGRVRLYAGMSAGVPRLIVRFPTGAGQIIATQP